MYKRVRNGQISNYLRSSDGETISSDPPELRNLHLALATRDVDGDEEVVGAAVVSRVQRSRREPVFWGAVIMLFGVQRTLWGKGIGSKLFNCIADWAAEQKGEDSRMRKGGDEDSHLIVLSAHPPEESKNWWLRRLKQRELNNAWQSHASVNEVQRHLGPKLPDGLWSPWPIAEQEVHVLTVDVDAIREVVDAQRRRELREAPLRVLRMAELGAGSARTTAAFVRYGWSGCAYDKTDKAIEWDAQHLPQGTDCVKIMDVRNLPSSELEGVDYVHCAPTCATVSNLAKSTHKRNEDNHFYGETPASAEYNETLQRMADLMTHCKECDPEHAFTLEQPEGIARNHPTIQARFEHESSPICCTRVVFDWCKVANSQVRKRTNLWIHGCEPLVDFFGTEDRPKFLCTEESPCIWGGPGQHPDTVRGRTTEYTPYPLPLVNTMAQIISAAKSHKRKATLRR